MTRLLVPALTALLVSLLASGCGSDEPVAAPSPTPTSTSTPTPLPTATAEPRPDVGDYYRLSYDEAIAPTGDDRAESCDDDHSAETYDVGTIDDVVDGHLVAVDSTRVQTSVATTCPAGLPDFVGGTDDQRRLSMIQAVWFTPTVAESDAGSDWYTCDAVVLASSQDLATLDSSLKGALDTPAGRDRYALCGTAQPGTADFSKVLCSDPAATWKALSVVGFTVTDYPGEDVAKARGQQTCKDTGRDVAADPLNYRWAYQFPSADDWAGGQDYGLCWAPV